MRAETLDHPRLGRNLEFARRVLESVFGYPEFRLQQRKAVLAALTGRDCLAVLPTGGGKSLCYQVPALVLPGLTLVVSPLISLMQDQVGTLRRKGVAAAYLSSAQDRDQQRVVWNAVRAERVKILYVAPERLEQVTRRLQPGQLSLLAVDEAHCISEWGHDFRPHYRQIGSHRQRLGVPTTIAVTATATPETRADICHVLSLSNPVFVTSSFDRPNLRFIVMRHETDFSRLHELRLLLRKVIGSAVIYLPTRERTDGVTTLLRQWGIPTGPYHAALPASARRLLLRDFLSGKLRVIAATNAFGMGIDKADVRLVAHLGVPPRPEAYFQEAGRAGRDGAPADCVMLWTPKDLVLARFFARAKSCPKGSPLREARQRGLNAMRRYVLGHGCRRRVLLSYLGDPGRGCAGCDRCFAGR